MRVWTARVGYRGKKRMPDTTQQTAPVAGKLSPPGYTVSKFGGTSVADPACIRRCITRLQHAENDDRQVVVVSALAGVTDRLISLVEIGGSVTEVLMADLVSRHIRVARRLLRRAAFRQLSRRFHRDAIRLRDLLAAKKRDRDAVVAFGELWSARLFAAALSEHGLTAAFIDARRFLKLNEAGVVDHAQSQRRLLHVLHRRGQCVPVITGYIAADARGRTRTLGRNGSDYSAALVSSYLRASVLNIYSDVSGVLSADPDHTEHAVTLDALSYEQAERLARLGARVLHPRCIEPLKTHRIPMVVANAHDPKAPATLIGDHPGAPISGVVCHPPDRLRFLPAPVGASPRTTPSPVTEFSLPNGRFRVRRVAGPPAPYSILCIPLATRQAEQQSAITEGLLALLRAAGITAICAESSEVKHAIVLAVDAQDQQRALHLVHQRLFHSRRRLHLALVGAGRVGQALLGLIERQQILVRIREDLDLRVCAIANSKRMLCSLKGLTPDQWQASGSGVATDLKALTAWMSAMENPIWIDASASAEVSNLVETLQCLGIAVVTANKLAATVPLERFAARCRHRVPFLHGTTVGAGVPVLECAEALSRGGEKVRSVRATLSGSVSWILARVNGGQRFSEALRQAHALGLTEPDPRQDLSGQDVQRKLVILARHLGLPIDAGDVQVSPLIPEDWLALDSESFDSRLPSLDEKFRIPANESRVFCYLATIDARRGLRAELALIDPDDPLLRSSEGDNVIEIRTDNYLDNPLVLRGPGAGVAVTAAGLLSDLLLLSDTQWRTDPVKLEQLSLRAA